MITTLFTVSFHNGSKFNVFCSGKNQINRFKEFVAQNKNEIESIKEILNGIHTVKEFEKITTNKL